MNERKYLSIALRQSAYQYISKDQVCRSLCKKVEGQGVQGELWLPQNGVENPPKMLPLSHDEYRHQ